MRYFKAKKTTVEQTIYHVTMYCKQLKVVEYNRRNKTVVFEGVITPTLSKYPYNIIIKCKESHFPKVYVTNLDFKENRPEHLYPDNSLCLFYPKSDEYKLKDMIYPKILDWTALWLYFYEIWLNTGEWLGGGISHINEEKEAEE